MLTKHVFVIHNEITALMSQLVINLKQLAVSEIIVACPTTSYELALKLVQEKHNQIVDITAAEQALALDITAPATDFDIAQYVAFVSALQAQLAQATHGQAYALYVANLTHGVNWALAHAPECHALGILEGGVTAYLSGCTTYLPDLATRFRDYQTAHPQVEFSDTVGLVAFEASNHNVNTLRNPNYGYGEQAIEFYRLNDAAFEQERGLETKQVSFHTFSQQDLLHLNYQTHLADLITSCYQRYQQTPKSAHHNFMIPIWVVETAVTQYTDTDQFQRLAQDILANIQASGIDYLAVKLEAGVPATIRQVIIDLCDDLGLYYEFLPTTCQLALELAIYPPQLFQVHAVASESLIYAQQYHQLSYSYVDRIYGAKNYYNYLAELDANIYQILRITAHAYQAMITVTRDDFYRHISTYKQLQLAYILPEMLRQQGIDVTSAQANRYNDVIEPWRGTANSLVGNAFFAPKPPLNDTATDNRFRGKQDVTTQDSTTNSSIDTIATTRSTDTATTTATTASNTANESVADSSKHSIFEIDVPQYNPFAPVWEEDDQEQQVVLPVATATVSTDQELLIDPTQAASTATVIEMADEDAIEPQQASSVASDFDDDFDAYAPITLDQLYHPPVTNFGNFAKEQVTATCEMLEQRYVPVQPIYHVFMISDQLALDIMLQVCYAKSLTASDIIIITDNLPLVQGNPAIGNTYVYDMRSYQQQFAQLNQQFNYRSFQSLASKFAASIAALAGFNKFELYASQVNQDAIYALLVSPFINHFSILEHRDKIVSYPDLGEAQVKALYQQFSSLHPYSADPAQFLTKPHLIENIYHSEHIPAYEHLVCTGTRYFINFG